tara:strand:+ start:4778 stop:5149 length:372 start_codon:yes stop_codon:yes gene_type:complete
MKEQIYTYTETEYFILQNLYYSMGVNRMKWYEYRELMIPSLKDEIMVALANCAGSVVGDYNNQDIAKVLSEIKGKFDIFGEYEGDSTTYGSLLLHFGELGRKVKYTYSNGHKMVNPGQDRRGK